MSWHFVSFEMKGGSELTARRFWGVSLVWLWLGSLRRPGQLQSHIESLVNWMRSVVKFAAVDVPGSVFLTTGVLGELNVFDPDWTLKTKDGYHYGIQGYQSTTYLVWGSHSVFIPMSAYETIGIFAAFVSVCVLVQLWWRRASKRNLTSVC